MCFSAPSQTCDVGYYCHTAGSARPSAPAPGAAVSSEGAVTTQRSANFSGLQTFHWRCCSWESYGALARAAARDNKAVSQRETSGQLSRQGEQVCALKVRERLPFPFHLHSKASSKASPSSQPGPQSQSAAAAWSSRSTGGPGEARWFSDDVIWKRSNAAVISVKHVPAHHKP